MSVAASKNESELARRIGLPLLIFYGLGTILGAGIYVLVGKVAASAGLLAPLAFLVAAIVASITALSYCQLVTFYPKSSGEAYYVEHAFNKKILTTIVGYLVIFTGVVSAATLANGFVGYLKSFFDVSSDAVIVLTVLTMGAIAIVGIAESLWLAAVITIVEISGLFIVVFYGASNIDTQNIAISTLFIPTSWASVSLVLSGAFLAFYAFIGFEDMVNIVEEVKEPEKTMPRAIVVAIIVSTLLYVLVAVVAILALPLDELSSSSAPLKDIVEQQSNQAGVLIGVISLFAIVNGILTQMIMGSRVLYGMSNQGRAPLMFKQVFHKTKTPLVATFAIITLVLLFALVLPLESLAKVTSFIVLSVFTLVNISLWRLTRLGIVHPHKSIPSQPLVGALLCIGLLIFQLTSML